jgi:hypothetical protein
VQCRRHSQLAGAASTALGRAGETAAAASILLLLFVMLQSRIFTTTAGSALWAPEIPGLMMRLQGHVSLDQYQLLLNHGLQMYTGHRHPEAVAHWIVDLRQLSTLHPAAHHWMAHDWHPRAHAAGLRHVRFVEAGAPAASTTQLLLAALMQLAADPTLSLTQHDTLEAAIQQARVGVPPVADQP